MIKDKSNYRIKETGFGFSIEEKTIKVRYFHKNLFLWFIGAKPTVRHERIIWRAIRNDLKTLKKATNVLTKYLQPEIYYGVDGKIVDLEGVDELAKIAEKEMSLYDDFKYKGDMPDGLDSKGNGTRDLLDIAREQIAKAECNKIDKDILGLKDNPLVIPNKDTIPPPPKRFKGHRSPPPPPPPPPGRHVHAPIIDKTTVPLGKYPMGKSQPAQIDCRYCEWVHHKDGACHNISPSITLNNFPAKGQMWTCWSKTNKPKL